MKTHKLAIRGALGLLLSTLLHVAPAAAQSTLYIQKLVVSGNQQVTGEKIRRVLRLQVGDALERETVAEALKRLFATRQFNDIEATQDSGTHPDSVVVTVLVAEYPKIDEVRFEGLDHVDKEDLDKVVSVTRGSFVRPALIGRDEEAISEVYRDKGYYRVAVRDTIVYGKEKSGRVLIYSIDEGEKVSVKHIDFVGVRELDTDDVRGVMSLKQDSWWRGADFKPKEFAEDDGSIISLYKSRGFLDVEIVDKELVFSDDGKDLDIFITVSEGTQYVVGDISWTGNELFPDTTIGNLVTMNKGEPFDELLLSQIQFEVGNIYWDRGYIYSTVSPVKSINGKVVDVDFDIVQGNLAHVNEINITGNTKTAEHVIRRQLVLTPGDVFASGRLRRSLREVFNLGFFAGPPQVSTNPANEKGDIDVTLRVEEKPAGQFRMGAGFSQLNKVSGFIGVSEPNFLGRGLSVGLDWEFSKFRQNVSLQFTEPWLFGTPTQLSLSVFSRVQNQVQQQFYSDRRTGFSARVGRPFPWMDYTTVFARYGLESVELSDFSPNYIGSLRDIDWPQTTSSFGLTFLRNSTDNPFHPTTGTRTRLNARWTGAILGGDVQFQRYEAEFSWYHPLFWKFVLEVRDQLGIMDGFNNPGEVPDYELFRLGGNRTNSLRGYDFFEVVPEGNPEFIGGRFMHVLSYELSFPLAPPTIYGLMFFDSGNTWNSFKEADILNLKKGAGVGIRIELPMLGTVGLDYGYGYDRLRGGSWEPHITFGGVF